MYAQTNELNLTTPYNILVLNKVYVWGVY